MNKVKFAVIGQGHIGKRHAEMVRRNPSCELVAVCDVLEKNALGLAELDVPIYNDHNAMLQAHPDIEVINVCSPNGFHAEHAMAALENGKHVVCEKPMALHKQDCESLIYKALQMHRQVFCVMQNRFSV